MGAPSLSGDDRDPADRTISLTVEGREVVQEIFPSETAVFMPFHFAEAAANDLTHAALDPVAKIPEYKVCAVAAAVEANT